MLCKHRSTCSQANWWSIHRNVLESPVHPALRLTGPVEKVRYALVGAKPYPNRSCSPVHSSYSLNLSTFFQTIVLFDADCANQEGLSRTALNANLQQPLQILTNQHRTTIEHDWQRMG